MSISTYVKSTRQSCLGTTNSWNIRLYKSVTIQMNDGNWFDCTKGHNVTIQDVKTLPVKTPMSEMRVH